MSEHDKAVRDLLRQTAEAWRANDAEGYAALYRPDATVTLSNGTHLRDRDEIRAYMAAGFAGPLRGTTAVDEVESVRVLGPGAAVAISRSGFTPPAGPMRRATWTLARDGEDWRVAAYANCPLE